MRLLITRPAERSGPLQEKLMELGFEISLAPLLTISKREFTLPEVPLQGVIFTSVQGVEAVSLAESLKIFPAFTVGSKTAGAAASVGFFQIHNADGNVEDLFDLIVKMCKPGKGLILHLAGENTVGQLVPRLQKEGFEAEYKSVYKAVASTDFPANVVEKFERRQIDGVVFFSTRTAAIFNDIVRQKNLDISTQKMEAFCLSENIADETKALGWKKINISEDPTENSMINLLQGIRK